jgi:UDP-glucuronate 4-epimerase
MKVLVTGHAGFIGSHLTDRLLERGHEVIGVDNRDPFYDPGIKETHLERAREFDTFHDLALDIRDPALEDAVPEGVDVVVHLAALAGVRPSIERPREYQDVNVGGTAHLLELARRRGIDRFVFASSSSVYGNNRKVPFSEEDPVDHPISPYAATKRSGELIAHTYAHLFGMRTICLRFFTVYGPRQRPDLAIHKFARLLQRGEPIPMFGDGTTERDYTYIDDIIQGVEAAVGWTEEASRGGFEIVNLGESRTISLREMIDVVGAAMSVEPEIRRLPLQPGDVQRTWADISRARRLLGYAPSTGFTEGVERFASWFRDGGGG